MTTTTTHAVTVALQTDKALSAYGPLAKTIEQYGFDGITVYNDMLFQPAWLPLMEIARATQSTSIGVAAVNPFTCHPINIAGNIALLDEASQGRAYLGLARGGWLDFVGLAPKRTVTALREAFQAVRHLLRQSKEPLAGDLFPLAGGDTLRWSILRSEIPFLLGSWGETTIRACADQIAEIKIGGSANAAVIPHFQQILANAAAQKSNVHEVGICIGAVCVVDKDGQAAREHVKREVALYLPVVAELDPTVDLEPALLSRLKAAADRYDFDGAASLISDDLLKRFAFAGTPDEIAEHAATLFAAGATRVEFGTPHGLTTEEGLRLLGTRVLPALRR